MFLGTPSAGRLGHPISFDDGGRDTDVSLCFNCNTAVSRGVMSRNNGVNRAAATPALASHLMVRCGSVPKIGTVPLLTVLDAISLLKTINL